MTTVAIIGLGYVGLPLAVEFGRHFRTIGFDLSAEKVANFRRQEDPTLEVNKAQFLQASLLEFTADEKDLAQADFFIVAVPTPVDDAHRPDFTPLIMSSAAIGRQMKKGSVVVYESTVYPGATEEICVPELEKASGMTWKKDFFIGYSPERINPGDKVNTLTKIVKVVAGDSPEVLNKVASMYGAIITAGVHRASSIKVAEAAKVIENTQRDLNIALMNELSMIFSRVGIDTMDVLEAAGTKWNFLKFRPGLVGGHCIGVDPYYLTHKAEQLGYIPQVILAGRRINDAMGPYVARQAIKEMIKNGHQVQGGSIIVLGISFKEDVPDLRNSKVFDLIRELKSYGMKVFVHDPVVTPESAMHEYGIELTPWDKLPKCAGVVMAVNHKEFLAGGPSRVQSLLMPHGVFVDVKSAFKVSDFTNKGLSCWRM